MYALDFGWDQNQHIDGHNGKHRHFFKIFKLNSEILAENVYIRKNN